MELPKQSIDRLKTLKQKTEASSYAEVTKNAYRLYEWIIELHENGKTLLVKNASGDVEKLELFL